MQTIVIVGGAALLLGFFVGWLVGHAAGYIDGREGEKQRQAEKTRLGN